MPEKVVVSMTEMIVESPTKVGAPPPWSFPPVCACCGASADSSLPKRVEATNVKGGGYYYNVQIPYCTACATHVSEHKNALVKGYLIGGLISLVLFGPAMAYVWYRSGWDEMARGWTCVGLVIVGFFLTMLFSDWLAARATGSDRENDDCTSEPDLALYQGKGILMNPKGFVLAVRSCNERFLSAFRQRNNKLILKEQPVEAHCVRTDRGYLIVERVKDIKS